MTIIFLLIFNPFSKPSPSSPKGMAFSSPSFHCGQGCSSRAQRTSHQMLGLDALNKPQRGPMRSNEAQREAHLAQGPTGASWLANPLLNSCRRSCAQRRPVPRLPLCLLPGLTCSPAAATAKLRPVTNTLGDPVGLRSG